MAFNPANLTPQYYLAAESASSLVWTYTTTDDVGDIDTGYFTSAGRMLRTGDLIQVTADDGKVLLLVNAANIFTPSAIIGIIAYGVDSF
jgi:hypothetical protein